MTHASRAQAFDLQAFDLRVDSAPSLRSIDKFMTAYSNYNKIKKELFLCSSKILFILFSLKWSFLSKFLIRKKNPKFYNRGGRNNDRPGAQIP